MSDHVRILIENDVLGHIMPHLIGPNDKLREQAIWALGNISGDSVEFRDLCLAHGCLPLVVQLLLQGGNLVQSALRNATWTLSNLVRGKPSVPLEIALPALPALAQLIYSTDDEVLGDALWALSYITDGEDERIQAVIEAGVARRVVELLAHPSHSVQTPALRTVGNIVTGNDLQTQVMLNVGVVEVLSMLTQSPRKALRKESLWSISNITAGNVAQIQAVIDAGAVPAMINSSKRDDQDIRKEALWAMSNMTAGGNKEQITYAVHQGILDALCVNLESLDNTVVMVCLEGLENVLKTEKAWRNLVDECGGVESLGELEGNPANEEVADKARNIIETYLVEDDPTVKSARKEGTRS